MTTIKEFLKPTSQISIGDASQTGKSRIANIYDDKGRPIKLILAKDCSLRTPWPVASFDGGDRCSLDIIMNDELEKMVDKIDVLVLEWIKKDVQRYLKNAPTDISLWYKSLREESTKECYANTPNDQMYNHPHQSIVPLLGR